MLASWAFWALLSALFAALTAIFAKIGLDRVDSDFATFIRTLVILVTLGGILAVLGKFQATGSILPRSWLFLVLSGLATGASWICYFRALARPGVAGGAAGQVQRGAGGTARRGLPRRTPGPAPMARRSPGDSGRGGPGNPPISQLNGASTLV